MTLGALKSKVDGFIKKHSPPEDSPPVREVSDNTSIAERTLISQASSLDTKTSKKNDKLLNFLAVLYAKPAYDRNGTIISLTPADISDEAKELLTTATSTAEQARSLADALFAHADEIRMERNYVSRSSNFPFLSLTALTYFLQGYLHLVAIDQNIEGLKKSFNLLALLPPSNSEDYKKYVNASRNNEVETVLDHPTDKRSTLKKDVFIKGKQDTIEDVLTFASNIVTFARFWIEYNEKSLPLVLETVLDICDAISTSDFKKFVDSNIVKRPFIPHTLVAYLFNIFSVL